MLRLVLYLAAVIALAVGFSWLADRPGDIVMVWQGYRVETNVFHGAIALGGIVALVLVLWSLLRHIWESPASVGQFFQQRRQSRGLDALSSGMIAIGAGDREQAMRFAILARKSLPNEPLTHLLRAQAAQLNGDKATSRRIFEAMLGAPDTEQLGLRGLYIEAVREGEEEAAAQFAERAVKLNPKLEWSAGSLFELQCKRGDWQGALQTLATLKRNSHVEKASANRRRAVLLSAQAQEAEDSDTDTALNLALEAHGLAPDLIVAAAIAGRLLASKGNTPRAAKVIQKTWTVAPHPELAVAYAYARPGDSPRDRLERVSKLAALNVHSIESPIALATAAIEAKDFAGARHSLEPLLERRLTQRVCTLMARLESEEHGDKGKVREWLARAVNAPRDPAWTADGIVSDTWAAVSPVTGALDAFQWRVPVESLDLESEAIVASKLEEFVALGAHVDAGGDSELVDVSPAATDSRSRGTHSDRSPVAGDERAEDRSAGGQEELPAEDDWPGERARSGGASRDASTGKQVKAGHGDGGDEATARAKPNKSAAIKRDDVSPADELPEAVVATPRKDPPRSRKKAARSGPNRPASEDSAGTNADLAREPKKPDVGASEPKKAPPRGKRKRRKKSDDARIFVSPRAPDDPGTDTGGDLERGRGASGTPYRRRHPA